MAGNGVVYDELRMYQQPTFVVCGPQVPTTVCPQLFALNCSPSTVRPQLLFALNYCLPSTNTQCASDKHGTVGRGGAQSHLKEGVS